MTGSESAEHRSSAPLRVAVIGVGFIGAVHARAARLAGARIVGVAAGSPVAARRAADALGVAKTYSSPADVADDTTVDVVHVCTPNALHEPYAHAAIAAGKHVICEKPLGIDLPEAAALRDQARRAGVVATVPFAYRFHPMVREFRERVRRGDLGPLRLAHGSYLQDWMADPASANWRSDGALGGTSRAFADIGSHWCDLMEFVSGDRITRLSAALSFGTFDGSTEDAAVLVFETRGGATGSMLVSQISRGHNNQLTLELDGRLASARFDQERPDILEFTGEDGSRVLHRGSPTLSAAASQLTVLPAGHNQGFNDAFGLFVAHTYDAIRGAGPDGLPTFDDGWRAAAVVDAVLRSARSGQWVEIEL